MNAHLLSLASTRQLLIWSFGLLLACSLMAVCTAATEPLRIRIPDSEQPEFVNQRNYSTALIRLALQHHGSPFELVPSGLKLGNTARTVKFISKGDFDISGFHYSPALEQHLLAIKIPILKGIIGWRIAFIKSADRKRFANVAKLEDLQAYTAAQGFNWPDVDIFRTNGLPVATTAGRENLFGLLHNGRADYFPRSVLEIWDDQQVYGNDTLVIEENLLLHYPSAVYFFVNKKNKVLAQAIENGLLRAIEDGSFDALFTEYFGERLAKARIANRTLIKLDNPSFVNPRLGSLNRQLYSVIEHKQSQ